MSDTIRFKVVDGEINPDIKSVQIYRPYITENEEVNWGYIDSLHPMSKMDLLILKNTIQEYLQKYDWD
tara:strand:+ start:1299 stop:1502 length:204 start_codon:yes stop_codon:yes gene_type:complete